MKRKITLKFSKKKARNKVVELTLYFIVFLFISIFMSIGDLNRGIIVGAVLFLIFVLPQLLIFLNYLKHDKGKKVIFDYPNNIFQEHKNGKLISEINISDIKMISHYRGKIDSYSNSLPHMNYSYHKVCTNKQVFVFSHFMENDNLEFQSKGNKSVSFFNLMNLKNDYRIEQNKIIKESNDINYYTNSRVLEFIEKYENKTDKELQFILDNKKSFQKEAIKASQFILKGRKKRVV